MTAQQQFESFLRKYDPAIAAETKKVLAKLRKLVPGAVEMVYDNYNALVIGFCPGMRPSEAILSIAVSPRWVTLCFLDGKGLPDPEKRLRGSGNLVRNIRLEGGAKALADPYLRTLIGHALERAKVPIPAGQKSQFLIKSVSAKQRPRRPTKRKALARSSQPN
jgi:hypothetical protein